MIWQTRECEVQLWDDEWLLSALTEILNETVILRPCRVLGPYLYLYLSWIK